MSGDSTFTLRGLACPSPKCNPACRRHRIIRSEQGTLRLKIILANAL